MQTEPCSNVNYYISTCNSADEWMTAMNDSNVQGSERTEEKKREYQANAAGLSRSYKDKKWASYLSGMVHVVGPFVAARSANPEAANSLLSHLNISVKEGYNNQCDARATLASQRNTLISTDLQKGNDNATNNNTLIDLMRRVLDEMKQCQLAGLQR